MSNPKGWNWWVSVLLFAGVLNLMLCRNPEHSVGYQMFQFVLGLVNVVLALVEVGETAFDAGFDTAFNLYSRSTDKPKAVD